MSKKNEFSELEKLGRIRNRLLAASTLRSELRRTAERVMRLSEEGKLERFFTLSAVADESGLSIGAIGSEVVRLAREQRRLKREQKAKESK